VAATDDLPYPRYQAASTGSWEGVIIALNIDDYVDVQAPGLTAELVQAIHDTIAARPEFTGARISRMDITPTDITPAATG
jgi:hypothetical protein